MLAAKQIIHITEVPDWVLVPFIIVLVAALTLTVRWVLGPPKG